jgi:hypothetical protein
MRLSQFVTALLLLSIVTTAYTLWRGDTVEEITARWEVSGHADENSSSFTHWDDDDPPVIPATCAECHSQLGFVDYVGADGSTPLEMDSDHPIGSVIGCHTCHNTALAERSSAVFPSGAVVGDLGSEIGCMHCHQGRQSTGSVQRAIAPEGVALPLDEVHEDLGFINVHYNIAAASLMGSVTTSAYQYVDRPYVGRFEHAPYVQTCTDCHDAHGLHVDAQACAPCHLNVVDRADIADIRMTRGGLTDGGIRGEIDVMAEALYRAIQDYTVEVMDTHVIYAPNTFPYFFIDSNANGEVDEGEAAFPNRLQTWTPRLVRTTYNLNFVTQDPGIHVHNAKYALQFLYDSIEDLAEVVPVDMNGMVRP